MTPLQRAEAAIRSAIQSQFSDVYMWDRADERLFDDGAPTWSDFEGGIKLADRFDLAVVARAVLQAIREPSFLMTAAGTEKYPRIYDDGSDGEITAEIWQAMIDAALEEGMGK